MEIIRDWVEEVQRVVWDRDGGSNLEFGDFAIEPMQGERPITLRQMGLLEEAGWEFS